jgi:hypothetical protein
MNANRTTVPVATNILPEMLERAKVDAERKGYRSLRAYLEALIAQDDDDSPLAEEETQALTAAYPSSAWALGPTILLHRTVVALEAVAQRIRAGEDVGTLERDLTALRREIGEHLFALREDYDHEVEARDQRHYRRGGVVE